MFKTKLTVFNQTSTNVPGNKPVSSFCGSNQVTSFNYCMPKYFGFNYKHLKINSKNT